MPDVIESAKPTVKKAAGAAVKGVKQAAGVATKGVKKVSPLTIESTGGGILKPAAKVLRGVAKAAYKVGRPVVKAAYKGLGAVGRTVTSAAGVKFGGAAAPAAEAAVGAGAVGAGAAAAAGIASAVMMLDKAAKDSIKTVTGWVKSEAVALVGASTDSGASLERLGGIVSAVGEKVPVLGIAAVAAGEALAGFGAVMQALDKTVERYGEYSPEIAQAQALAEVNMVMGDLRRSAEVGEKMAAYVMAKSELEQKIEDFKADVMTVLIPIITDAVDFIIEIKDDIKKCWNIIKNPVRVIFFRSVDISEEEKKDIHDPTDQILNNPNFGSTLPSASPTATANWVPNS